MLGNDKNSQDAQDAGFDGFENAMIIEVIE